MGKTRMSSLQAKSEVIVALEDLYNCTFQERYFLLKIEAENADSATLDLPTSHILAKLARQTLVAEYRLAVAQRDAHRQELAILEDAVDDALVHMVNGRTQEARIYRVLSKAGIHAPWPDFPPLHVIADSDGPSNLFDDDLGNRGCSDSETDYMTCDSKSKMD